MVSLFQAFSLRSFAQTNQICLFLTRSVVGGRKGQKHLLFLTTYYRLRTTNFYMAITQSAKKAARSSETKRVYNIRRQEALRDAVKAVRKAVTAGKGSEAEKLLKDAYQAIDKAAKRGVIKKNAANRKKSRLVAAIRRIAK